MPETPEIPEELLPAEVADAKPSAPEIAATEGVAEIHENEKEETPVLDVHPAHHAASTWKEFFIHIATIVLGLIIAVGLEQLVERIHQRYELSETREALKSELQANHNAMQGISRNWRWETAELENDLTVLRFVEQHPHTPQTELPGDLLFIQYPVEFKKAVWTAAQQNGITRLLPLEEANRNSVLYTWEDLLAAQGMGEWDAFNDAGRFTLVDGDPTHLTPQQLDRTLQALELALEKHIQLGDSLAYIHNHFPELGSPITYHEVESFKHSPSREHPQEMARAHQLTIDRLVAAGLTDEEARSLDAVPSTQ
jgi:type II secretory pathway pseudopilin PulG